MLANEYSINYRNLKTHPKFYEFFPGGETLLHDSLLLLLLTRQQFYTLQVCYIGVALQIVSGLKWTISTHKSIYQCVLVINKMSTWSEIGIRAKTSHNECLNGGPQY